MKKEELISACRDILQKRVNEYKKEMDALQQDLQHESKSTAGDKHETGRAMLHLEAEKCSSRLRESEELLMHWDRIDFSTKYSEVLPGALIITNYGIFLYSVGAGKILLNHLTVYLLSSSSPLIKSLNGKMKGDNVTVQQQTYKIESIE
jgi:hypothetical protein